MNSDRIGLNRRMSPRPYGLHLWMATIASANCLSGLTGLRNGWPGWNGPEPAALRARLAFHDDAAVAAAVRQSVGTVRFTISWRASSPIAPIPTGGRCRIHRSVACTMARPDLLDYSAPGRSGHAMQGRRSLLVPSLVNRGYVLDLMPDVSLARYLSAAGVPVYLLEWNTPDAEESRFDLDRLVRERLIPALDAKLRRCAGPPRTGRATAWAGLLALLAGATAHGGPGRPRRPGDTLGFSTLNGRHRPRRWQASLAPGYRLSRRWDTFPSMPCKPCSRPTIRWWRSGNSGPSLGWRRTPMRHGVSWRWRTG